MNPNPDLEATKAACNETAKNVEEAKLAVTTKEAKRFELYGNLSSHWIRQPWGKVMKAQVIFAPWEDI